MPEKQILDKLDNIQKDQNRSSALANSSFGLALTAIAISVVQNTTRLDIIIICAILGSIGLGWFLWNIMNWRLTARK